MCAHKLSSNQYLYDTMQYCKTVQWCYSLNTIVSSHLSYAFSYSRVYAVVIGVSVSVGIVMIPGVGGGIVIIIAVIKWRNNKKKEIGGSGLNHTLQ